MDTELIKTTLIYNVRYINALYAIVFSFIWKFIWNIIALKDVNNGRKYFDNHPGLIFIISLIIVLSLLTIIICVRGIINADFLGILLGTINLLIIILTGLYIKITFPYPKNDSNTNNNDDDKKN